MKYITYLILFSFVPLLANAQSGKLPTGEQGVKLKTGNDAVISIFPQKFTKNDIFSITCDNPDTTVNKVTYKVIFDKDTISGEFLIVKKMYKALICLPCEFSVATKNSGKVDAIITDNKNNTTKLSINLVEIK